MSSVVHVQNGDTVNFLRFYTGIIVTQGHDSTLTEVHTVDHLQPPESTL